MANLLLSLLRRAGRLALREKEWIWALASFPPHIATIRFFPNRCPSRRSHFVWLAMAPRECRATGHTRRAWSLRTNRKAKNIECDVEREQKRAASQRLYSHLLEFQQGTTFPSKACGNAPCIPDLHRCRPLCVDAPCNSPLKMSGLKASHVIGSRAWLGVDRKERGSC